MKSYLVSDMSSFAFKSEGEKVFVQDGLGAFKVCALKDTNWFLAVETEREPVFLRASLSMGSADSRRMELRLHTRTTVFAASEMEAENKPDLYGPILDAFAQRASAQDPVLDCVIQCRKGRYYVRELTDIWEDLPMFISSENVFSEERTEYRIPNPIRSKQYRYRDDLRPGEESREVFQSWRKHMLAQFSTLLQEKGGAPLSSSEEEKAFALCVNYAERKELIFKRQTVKPVCLQLGTISLRKGEKAITGTAGDFQVFLKDRRPEKMAEICEKLGL